MLTTNQNETFPLAQDAIASLSGCMDYGLNLNDSHE